MATFNIRAILDPTGVIAGSRAASASLIGLQRQANILSSTFGKAFALIGVGVGIKKSIDLIADFELSIATATAVATRDLSFLAGNMSALTEEARRLGATTKFTAKEAADGMLFLARAGFTVNEVLAITNDTLRLAQAGNLGVGRAADIVTNVMAGFSAAVSESTRFVDVLAKAANQSNTNIEQLGDALKFAGPVAAATGVSIEETAAAVGVLSNAGLQGTLAGTGLRRVLSELEAPSVKARKFLKNLGLTQRDVSVTTNGLVPVIEKLIKAGFDVGDSFEYFNDRGGVAFQVLKDGVQNGSLQALTKQLQEAKDTARNLATFMDATLSGAMKTVNSAFEALQLSLGNFGDNSQTLQNAVRGVAGVLRKLAANIEIVSKVVLILSSIIVTVLVRNALVFLNGAILRLFAVIAANPAAAAAIAIIALTTALIAFSDKISVSADGATTLRDVFVGIFGEIKSAVKTAADILVNVFGLALKDAGNKSSSLGLVILAALRNVAVFLDFLVGASTFLIFAVITSWDSATKAIGDILKVAANFWLDTFDTAVNGIIGLLNKIPKVDIDLIQKGPRFEVNNANIDNFVETFKASIMAGLEDLPEQFGGSGGPIERALNRAIKNADEISAKSTKDKLDREKAAALQAKVIAAEEGLRFTVLLANLGDEIFLLNQEADARERIKRIRKEEENFDKGFTDRQAEQLDRRLQLIQAIERQNTLYQQTTSGQLNELARQEETLGQLYIANKIALQEYGLAIEDVRLKSLQLALDIDSGEQSALIRVKQEIRDIASLTENTLVNAFQSVEDAIVSFVSTGEADFHKLAQTIFAETSRILIRLALLKAFQSFFSPAGASPLPTDFQPLGRFQHGGGFNVGGSGGPDSQRVSFLASPGERVDVTPPGKSPENIQQPVVNLKNVTILDPNLITDAMSTASGERIILNIVQRNRSQLKKVLSG